MSRTSKTTLGGLVLAGALALSSCASAEPSAESRSDEDQALVVGVNVNSMEQMVLGELLQQALNAEGVPATMQVDTSAGASPMDLLRAGHADIAVGCTGTLLEQMDSSAAKDLTAEQKKAAGAQEGQDFQDSVYKKLVAAMPGSYDMTDPSTAQGCVNTAQGELPQNIVPVYRKDAVNRYAYEALNTVNRTLTTKDLDEIMQEAKENTSISEAVSHFLATHSLGGGGGAEGQIKSQDEKTDI